ncbi:hypothetical protein ABB33_04030 [Stenotrophomonas acidaminiphila]|nr:hypothetical protein ABB33_04030 [Stenotrophomonas acidaminiphila]
MKTMDTERPGRFTVIAGALLGLLVMLHLRRYAGINHDAVLYLGQGLLQRWPEIFMHDPFFSHGSQEKYSLFPRLVGFLFGFTDPPVVFLWGVLLFLLLFAAACWYCLSAVLPRGQRYWAWLGILCLPSLYGGMSGMFGYSEQFFTPRLVAEALSLAGVGLLARDRWPLAIGCMALAVLFHPLQGIAAGIIVWSWMVMRDRRWLHVLWLVVPLLVLAWGKVQPFDGLFRKIDAEWLGSLQAYTRQLFVSLWRPVDFNLLGFDVLLLIYAWRTLHDSFARWCAASLLGLVLGLVASVLLVDVIHLVLPAGLQLWRVHWLAHWFAMASIGALVYRDAMAREWSRMALLALIILAAWSGMWWVWLPGMGVYMAWQWAIRPRNTKFVMLLGVLSALGCFFFFSNFFAMEWLRFRMAHYRFDLYAIDRRLLAFPIAGLVLLLPWAYAWGRFSRVVRLGLLILLLCPLLIIGGIRWDSRSVINLAYENAAFTSGVFGVDLAPDAQVYWDADSLTGPWLVLQRASYFSPGQLAGGVFHRDTIVEGNERVNRMRPLIQESMWCSDRSLPLEERESCHISDDTMNTACAFGPGRRPDYLVLQYKQPQPEAGRWEIIDPVTGESAVTFRLYRCADIVKE